MAERLPPIPSKPIVSGRRRSDGTAGTNGGGYRARSLSVREQVGSFFARNNDTVHPHGGQDGDFRRRTGSFYGGSTFVPHQAHSHGRQRSQGGSQSKVGIAPMVAAADDAPMMIICYSRDEAKLSYINKEVYRVLGVAAQIGHDVVDMLDPKFKSERSLEDCRALFGIGDTWVETKKSAIELRSAAGNTLPAMLVMRTSPGGEFCTATLFPGHGFQADFLEWQTAKTYRATVPMGGALSAGDIGGTSIAGHPTKPIFVEMDELRKIAEEDTVEWREVAHWKDGLEQSVAQGKDGEMQFGRAHLSTVKFHDFLLLRKLVQRGTVLIDLDVQETDARAALHFIASAIVSDMTAAGAVPDDRRDEVMQVILAQHIHATERRKKRLNEDRSKGGQKPSSAGGGDQHDGATPPASEPDDGHGGSQPGAKKTSMMLPPSIARAVSKDKNPSNAELRDADDEACDVLAGTVSFLEQQAAAFVRFKTAVDLGEMTEHEEGVKPPPVRFVFLVLGPPVAERDNHNVAHALACMMSNKDFAAKAQVLRNKDEVLETIDGSIDHTNLTFAQNIDVLRERAADDAGEDSYCCGLFTRQGDDPFAIEMDGGMPMPFAGRRRYSAVTIVEVPVNAAPPTTSTYEVQTIVKPDHIIKLKRRDALPGFLLFVVAMFAVLIMVFWHPHEQRRDVLTSKMTRYNTYITSPLFSVVKGHELEIPLDPDLPFEFVDIKMAGACRVQDCGGHNREHRRRMDLKRRGLSSVDSLATLEDASYVEWELVVEGRVCGGGQAEIKDEVQVEVLDDVDLRAGRCGDLVRRADDGHQLHGFLRVTTDSLDPYSVLVQVIQAPPIARYRVLVGGLLFVVTFAGIISEVIHRCYVTFIGSFCALALVAWTHEVPEIPTVIAMIDAGTLMLLFAMMVNVHLLSLTGFFQWFAVRMVEFSRGNVVVLFFLLTNMTGVLSAFLDNVTCVLLIGPVTIKLCEQMGMNPVPFYLTETIAATIGGTATLIGDPPNVVIGNKLSLRFNDFIIFNGPLVVVIMPLATVIQYFRFRHIFPKENVKLDLDTLKRDNKIHDERSLFFLSFIFLGIFLGLFLFELHGHEPAWFCLLGMLGASIATSRHDIRHVLQAVEWDTLLFFAGLFVFVESLAELGLIRFIGGHMSDFIKTVDIDDRLTVAMVIFLWVSAIGSAFLESLPYTTTITYIIINLLNEDDLGIPILPLAWALSVGACVGGIGSIMGSSANLVSIGVSERYSPGSPIKGRHFLQYGFPILLVSISIATLYQWVLFVQIRPYE